MNSPRIPQLRISPLHIQQGLFASLVLLVTLIVGQQFGRWDSSHQGDSQTTQQFIASNAYTTVSAPVSKDAARGLRPVEDTAPVGERRHPRGWVF